MTEAQQHVPAAIMSFDDAEHISRKRCYKCYIVDYQSFNLLQKVLQKGFKVLHG